MVQSALFFLAPGIQDKNALDGDVSGWMIILKKV